MTLAVLALAAQVMRHPIGNAERCIGAMIGAFLERGAAGGINRSCATANPAPPFLLSGPGK